MSAASRPRTALLLFLLLGAAGCSAPAGDAGDAATATGPAPNSPTSTIEVITTTTTSSQVLWEGFLTDLIDDAYADGGMVLRGRIVAAGPDSVRVEAADVLADWPPEEAASVGMLDLPIAPGRVWLPRALATALEDGPVPALVSVAGEGVFDVVVLTGDLRAFERDPGRGLPDELRGGVWAAEAIDRGPLKVPVKRVVVDPTRSLPCQDWLRSETLAYAPLDGDEVAGAVRFAEAVLASEEADDYRRELEARAVRVAENHYWQDPVTGTSNWPYIGDISDQLARGVPPEEVEVLPTTSVFLDPGDLEWLKPGGELLLFADTVTGRGLGWIDFWAHLSVDVEAPAGWLEVMLPPEGDLGLYLRPFEAERNTCAEDLPAPFLVISRDDLLARRWVLDMDAGRAVEWEG